MRMLLFPVPKSSGKAECQLQSTHMDQRTCTHTEYIQVDLQWEENSVFIDTHIKANHITCNMNTDGLILVIFILSVAGNLIIPVLVILLSISQGACPPNFVPSCQEHQTPWWWGQNCCTGCLYHTLLLFCLSASYLACSHLAGSSSTHMIAI